MRKRREFYQSSILMRLFCFVMNIIDFRYWKCGCHYMLPFGRCIMAGCKKHD